MNKLSRKEKRIKKQLTKDTKQKEKNVRLSSSVSIPDKYVRSNAKPPLEKTPRSTDPNNYKKYYFSWCDSEADTEGCWSWNENRAWSDSEFINIIKHHLDTYLNSSWGETELADYNGKSGYRKLLNKYQPLESIRAEAQDRWLEIDNISQFDSLFRLRLGTYRRIWGVRIEHHFYMVWYERHHEICKIDNNN